MLTRITLFAAMLAVAAPVAAEPSDTALPRASVGYGDLDLATPAGIATLKARVRAAAKDVCPRDPGTRDLVGHRISEHCLSDTSVTSKRDVALAINSARNSRPGVELAAR